MLFVTKEIHSLVLRIAPRSGVGVFKAVGSLEDEGRRGKASTPS
jgi:hypothetical protein